MSGRIFLDMDGVLVDFDRYLREQNTTSEECKKRPGAYLKMHPIEGALEAINSITGMDFEVWLATKPPTGVAHAYSDKAAWVFKHMPGLRRRLILTHDKGLLGDAGDILIDDHPERANCESFAGRVFKFETGKGGWSEALSWLRSPDVAKPRRRGAQ